MLIDSVKRDVTDIVNVNGVDQMVVEVTMIRLSIFKAKAPLIIEIGNRLVATPKCRNRLFSAFGYNNAQEFANQYMKTAEFIDGKFQIAWYLTRFATDLPLDRFFY